MVDVDLLVLHTLGHVRLGHVRKVGAVGLAFGGLMDEAEQFGPSVVGHEGQRVGRVVGGALVAVGADHEEGAS